MSINSLGYRTDVMIRRLSGSTVEDRDGYVVVRTPSNPGFYWGNFLLLPTSPTVAEAVAWETRFLAEFPEARHRAYGIDTTDGAIGDPAAVEALGVKARADAVMSASQLSEPPSSDLELRAFRADADWSQLPALRATVYPDDEDPADNPDEAAFIHRQVAATKDLVAAGHAQWFGGFDGDRLVAALGIVGDGSGVARYQSVETHPDYRRRGVARRLVYDASVFAAEHLNAQTLVIVADPDYHALGLYESLGFTTTELQVELLRAPSDD